MASKHDNDTAKAKADAKAETDTANGQKERITLSADLEAKYLERLNDPKKQGFYRAVGMTPEAVRSEFEAEERERRECQILLQLPLNAFLTYAAERGDELAFHMSKSPELLERARQLEAACHAAAESIRGAKPATDSDE